MSYMHGSPASIAWWRQGAVFSPTARLGAHTSLQRSSDTTTSAADHMKPFTGKAWLLVFTVHMNADYLSNDEYQGLSFSVNLALL